MCIILYMNILLTSKEYKSDLSIEQLQDLISLISNPAVFILPEGKAYTDIKKLEISVQDEPTRVDRMGSKAAEIKIEFK
jgi:hypothetical protein